MLLLENCPMITARSGNWLALWMRRMMRAYDLSAEAWATRAGIAGTTITRFLHDTSGDASPPSVRILTRLASVIGEPFPSPQNPGSRFTFVPLLNPELIAAGLNMDMACVGDVEVPNRFEGCHAVVGHTQSAVLQGILPGDTLVFRAGEPAVGALVVVVWPGGQAGVLRRVAEGYREEAPGMALHVEPGVLVMGQLVHMHRDMAA